MSNLLVRVTLKPSKKLSHFLCLSADSWTLLEFLYSLSLLFHQNLEPMGNSSLTVSNFSSLLQKQSLAASCRHMGLLGNTALFEDLGMKSTAAGWLTKEISNSIKKKISAWKEEYVNSSSIWRTCDLELLGHKYIYSWWQHLQWLLFTKYLSHWQICSFARGNSNLQISGE